MNQGTNLGSQKGRWLILAALVAVLGALLFLLPGVQAQAQESTTIEYTENSTDVVVTLSADDPEGATPITWSLPTVDPDGPDGPLVAADFQDNGVFKISQSGVLEFLSPPNHETPADEGANNTYNVVAQATDGDTGATPEDTRSWFRVTVNVADVEETGSVTLRPTAQENTTLLQPQVGVGITAANPVDGDGGVTGPSYQWYRTTSRTATGTAISSTDTGSTGTEAAYEPVHLTGGASDIGQYLRVVATYTDGRGAGKTATAVSMYPTIRAIQDNQAPSFRDGASTTRGVRETSRRGVNIGSPVSATDPEGTDDEKLTYWLDGTDAGLFSIDAATGQLKTDDPLDREATNGESHEVTVNVSDSSGAACNVGSDTDNCDEITVTILVLALDESPTIAGASTIEHVEGTTALDIDLNDNNHNAITNNPPDPAEGLDDPAVYTATDPEGGTITFSLGGADKDLFKLDDLATPDPNMKVLNLKASPDFENPMDSNRDNVYEVTVQATDDANMGMKAVTVKVTNRQEDGTINVSPAQPRIGIAVAAELTDSDVVSYGPTWRWERTLGADDETTCADKDAAGNEWDSIRGANSATYTPHSSDLEHCLRAVAMYNDGFHEGTAGTTAPNVGIYPDGARSNRFDKTANRTLSAVQYPSNNLPPAFGSTTTKRFVPENAAMGNNVGEPVTASDPNGAHTLAGYSLSGADQASFNINAHTGQLITAMKFDHESKPRYTVTVTAEDTDGATDSIRVDIYVGDVDEAPEATRPTMAENTVEYIENGTTPVLTLSAGDPEGATPITWSLPAANADPDGEGPLVADDTDDNGDFKIDPRSGVLEFLSPPNHETPADEGANNSYSVVVQATDGDTGATPEDTRGWYKVTINVSDVEEPGSVTLRPQTGQTDATLLQPQVGVVVTAANLADGDGGVTGPSYQWYRTTSRSATGTAISTDGDGQNYTPVHLGAGDRDIGKYLRVVATYTDGKGGGKEATAVSLYPTIRQIEDNTAPSFIEGTTTTRGVRETREKGVNIGLPVRATDPESAADEKLTYWLGGTDEALFSIDAATGQLKTNAALDRETGASHEVMVNVTDSSGSLTAAITVTIQVLELDESPTFTVGASTIEHVEGMAALDINLGNNNLDLITNNLLTGQTAEPDPAVYTASDPEGGTITFSLGGADKDLFKLDDQSPAVAGTKVLNLKASHDFENPMDSNRDNVYEVTVQASDDANIGTRAVTVKVTNRQEDGTINVSPAQPRIGIPVTAALTDSDVVSYGPMWNWQKGRTSADDQPVACIGAVGAENWMGIRGATSATYTPHASDLNYCLRAVAMYNDGFHEGTADGTTGIYPDTANRFDKTANRTLNAVQYPSNNLPPAFGSASTKRFVPENAAVGNNVGDPVTASDPNGAHTIAGYSLSGADQASFDINAHTGQLITEIKFNQEQKEMYTVTVTAEDTDLATDSIRVDIYVINVDERPGLMEGGISISGSSGVNYMENGTDAVGTYTATGAGAASATWKRGGDDADAFTVEGTGASVRLKFNSPPDYEAPADADGDNVYEVTLEANDVTYTASRNVSVTVTDVDELGTLTGTNSVSVMEGATDVLATYVIIGGPATVRIALIREGADADQFVFAVNAARDGLDLSFSSAPDYEAPADADGDNTYEVTVKVTAGGEETMVAVTVTVTNVEEDGTVTLSPESPVVGSPVTATLTDSDGGITDLTWIWETSSDMATWSAAPGTATSEGTTSTYTSVDDDVDDYLRATASYTDSYGPGNSVRSGSAKVVASNVAPEFPSASTTRTIPENTAAGSNIGAPVEATDPNGDTLTYTLGGTNVASFGIVGSTGQLRTSAALDFETKSTYSVEVTATDLGGLSDTIDVTINVTDVVEVVPEVPAIVQGYDTNNDGDISIAELFVAIDDYFEGGIITIAQLFDVIDAYFE